MNDLTDKWMMTCNGGWEVLVSVLGLDLGLGLRRVARIGGRKDCIEGKEGWEGWGEGKNNRMKQTSLPYVNL